MASLTDQLEQWTRFYRTLMAHLPKKYERHLTVILEGHPEVVDTQTVETSTTYLSLRWRCAPTEVAPLLQRMTARSHGVMTYEIGERQPVLGPAIRIHFHVERLGA